MVYKIHRGRSIIFLYFPSIHIHSSLQIALTQLHTQPGVIDQLLEETRDCVADIMKSDNKNDTPTVSLISFRTFLIFDVFQAVIYGTNQKVPDKSLVCDMAKLFIGACYDTHIPSTTTVD